MLNNARGFAHIGALVVGFLVVCFVGYFAKQQVAIYNERKTYREAEVQITQFTNAAAKLAPSTKEIRKYCSYSSAKYSRGARSCNVVVDLEYHSLSPVISEKVIENLNTIQGELPWTFQYDNTKGNKMNISADYISSRVYLSDGLHCSVSYRYKANTKDIPEGDTKNLLVKAHCSGTALEEYYPQ